MKSSHTNSKFLSLGYVQLLSDFKVGRIPIYEVFIVQRNSTGETQNWKWQSYFWNNAPISIYQYFWCFSKYPLITERDVANLGCFKL